MADRNTHLKRTEVTIRKRVKYEEKAFHIVNKLIDDRVTEEYLSECGRFISKENYADIVEERAISLLCGYPVCDETLPNVPKKKYHISTKANKVYDISERKNFCSNQCFKASKVFEQQIPESPIWSREADIEIVVSPHKAQTGLVGDEVVGRNPTRALKTEIEKLEEMDMRSVKKNAKDENSIVNSGTINPKDICDVSDKGILDSMSALNLNNEKNEQICDDDSISVDKNCSDFATAVDVNKMLGKRIEVSQQKHVPKSDEKNDTNKQDLKTRSISTNIGKDGMAKQIHSKPLSKLDQLQNLMQRKKTMLSKMVDSQEIAKDSSMHNQQKETKLSSSNEVSKNLSENNSFKKESENKNEYKLVHDSNTNVLLKPSHSPLRGISQVLKTWMSVRTIEYLNYKSFLPQMKKPQSLDFNDLKVQTDYTNLSVSLNQQEKQINDILEGDCEKYSKRTEDCNESMAVPDYEQLIKEADKFQLKVTEFITGKKIPQNDKKKPEESNEEVHLPTVDAYDQLQIRAKIVLERLDRVLPNLLTPLGLSVQDVSSSVRELVYTFRFERDTVNFKPAEWILVSLFLLKMLSYKMKTIEECFRKDSAVQYFTVVLNGIKQTLEDLDMCTKEILSDAVVNFEN